MTRLHVCSPKSFDERESGACLKASARNWFRVRYEEKKNLYLLCTVHGVYCICKDDANHVLQEHVLV